MSSGQLSSFIRETYAWGNAAINRKAIHTFIFLWKNVCECSCQRTESINRDFSARNEAKNNFCASISVILYIGAHSLHVTNEGSHSIHFSGKI